VSVFFIVANWALSFWASSPFWTLTVARAMTGAASTPGRINGKTVLVRNDAPRIARKTWIRVDMLSVDREMLKSSVARDERAEWRNMKRKTKKNGSSTGLRGSRNEWIYHSSSIYRVSWIWPNNSVVVERSFVRTAVVEEAGPGYGLLCATYQVLVSNASNACVWKHFGSIVDTKQMKIQNLYGLREKS
jgi:hypothetical protein